MIRILDPKGLMQEPGMDIYAEEGYKVTVTETSINHGYSHDKQKANKYLKSGGVYTVERTEVGGWHTDVWHKEFPEISFNSVHFHRIEPSPNL